MNAFEQGLIISGLGIALTFLALVLLIGVIYLLGWVFRVIPQDVDEVVPGGTSTTRPERAVAIAVAAWYFSQRRGRSLGERLTKKRSAWWGNG